MDTLPLRNTARPVANWLLIGVFMLLVQIVLGGITRLTGSGLSITEWDLATGALPPLNHAQWLAAFDKYKQTTQFQLLHAGFGLPDFKFIFFWEWFHRLWARLIGVVFLAGFAYLLWTKKIRQGMIKPLLILFLLGALQGAVGWIMVASGLTGDAIYVKPTKLALHFVFALGLTCATFWFALQLLVPAGAVERNGPIRGWTWIILAVLFFQLLFGALMAGHKAAISAPTWPTINGDWVPDSLFGRSPAWLNFVENPITIHFVHRALAYLLLLLTLGWSAQVYRRQAPKGLLHRTRWLPACLVCMQMGLGIAALLSSKGIAAGRWGLFEWLAQLHQVVGMLFLLTMLWMFYLVRPAKN
jgi:cytochrome c oxidase assembly protein subunit 15